MIPTIAGASRIGYLLAEQGKLPEAIREFEAVEAADELSPAAYRSLSDWYLANNQREKSEHAARAVYETTPEYRLSQMINAKLQPWYNASGHLPTRARQGSVAAIRGAVRQIRDATKLSLSTPEFLSRHRTISAYCPDFPMRSSATRRRTSIHSCKGWTRC